MPSPEVTIPENLSSFRRPVTRTLPLETWHLAKIRLDVAHAAGYRGEGIRVAVLDTGIEATHPHFGGVVEQGPNFIPTETDEDLDGHGTHVAGLVHSVAPAATIVNVKALDANAAGRWDGVAPAIVWAATHGRCDVINLSLGGMGALPFVMEQALAVAQDAGAIVVGAAGNVGDEKPFYPAHDPRVWAIGACDEAGQLWPWTSRGDIDLLAPGVNIYSSLLGGTFGFLSGTSMAAPLVAGCMALGLQRFAGDAARMVGGEGDSLRVVDAGAAVGVAASVWLPFVA